MEILYISSVPSKNEFYKAKEKIREGVNVTTYGMSEAGFKFHSLIQTGLTAQDDTHVYSLIGRSISHKTHRGVYWKAKKEAAEGDQTPQSKSEGCRLASQSATPKFVSKIRSRLNWPRGA